MIAKLTQEEFVYKANKIHNNKYTYDKTEYVNAKSKITITCPVHGNFTQLANNHINGYGCKKCAKEELYSNNTMTIDEFLSKSNKIHNNFYIYTKTKYIKSYKKIIITCPKHGDFEQLPYVHIRGFGCIKCSNEKKSLQYTHSNDDFIKKANVIHNKLYDYSKCIYKGTRAKICIICPIHGEFHQIAHNHLNGMGCKKCAMISQKSIITKSNKEFIDRCRNVHGNLYNYDKTNYKGSKYKVCITCNSHGPFYQSAGGHLKGQGCPKCNNSKGENIINNFLIRNNIEFIPEKTFQGCKFKKLLPFDFYIPSHNLCIEFDGKQHFESVDYFGGEKHLKYIKNNDLIKTNYCISNGIKLLRIKYTDFDNIEFILNTQLNITTATPETIFK